MDLLSVILLILHSIPVVTTFTLGMLLLVSYQERETPMYGYLRRVALCFYSVSFIASFGLMIFPYSAKIFGSLTPLHYGALITVPILLYHLIWILTPHKNSEEKFRIRHYILPIVVIVGLLVWSFFIPNEVNLALAQDREIIVDGYQTYSSVIHSRMEVRLLINIIYLIFILKRINTYVKANDITSIEYPEMKKWLQLLVGLSVTTFFVALLGVLKSGLTAYTSFFAFIVIFLLSFLQIELVLRLIKGYYPKTEKVYELKKFNPKPYNLYKYQQGKVTKKTPDKRQFEIWFKKNKPYLNPDFSINDLALELGVNRSYLSNFINTTYSINFTQYLNKYRLKELQRLMDLPSNKNKAAIDLVDKAGFGSYRNYLRAKGLEKNKK